MQGYLYFITCSIVGKVKIFKIPQCCKILINNLRFYRKQNDLKIFYYVIMDHHIHLIVSQSSDISKTIQDFKKFTAKEIISLFKSTNKNDILELFMLLKKSYKKKSTYQIWQEGSHPKLISSIHMLNQKIDYIHHNPVKRGFVSKPEDWYYSSARNFVGKSNPFDVDELEF